MILSFKERFVPLIINSLAASNVDGSTALWSYANESPPKIHTIRKDSKSRWRPGMKIHFWLGNPRNIGRVNYHPHEFAQAVCAGVQSIRIRWFTDANHGNDSNRGRFVIVHIDGRRIDTVRELEQLAINDGFVNFRAFCKWFNKDFNGKIIHWTDFKY